MNIFKKIKLISAVLMFSVTVLSSSYSIADDANDIAKISTIGTGQLCLCLY